MKTKEEHFEKGHFNIYTRDQDSHVTGYGKHARVFAACPSGGEMYCRVDMVWGLREPTEKEVLTVAKFYGDAKGKWELVSREPYTSQGIGRIDMTFRKAERGEG